MKDIGTIEVQEKISLKFKIKKENGVFYFDFKYSSFSGYQLLELLREKNIYLDDFSKDVISCIPEMPAGHINLIVVSSDFWLDGKRTVDNVMSYGENKGWEMAPAYVAPFISQISPSILKESGINWIASVKKYSSAGELDKMLMNRFRLSFSSIEEVSCTVNSWCSNGAYAFKIL